MKRRLHFNLKRVPTGSLSDYIQAVPSPSESRDLGRCGRKVRKVLRRQNQTSGRKEKHESERRLWCSTNSANYTGMDLFITRFTGGKLIASLCSSLGLSEFVSFQSSPSHILHCFSPSSHVCPLQTNGVTCSHKYIGRRHNSGNAI